MILKSDFLLELSFYRFEKKNLKYIELIAVKGEAKLEDEGLPTGDQMSGFRGDLERYGINELTLCWKIEKLSRVAGLVALVEQRGP